MKKIFSFLIYFLLINYLTSCTKSDIHVPINHSDNPLPSKEVITKNADQDFKAVLAGKKPIHAQIDNSKPILGDGGTRFYIAPGYNLTVMKKLDQKNGIMGYQYGPIIEFNSRLNENKSKKISDVKFYKAGDLMKLLKETENTSDFTK